MRGHLPAQHHGGMDPAPAPYLIRINGHLGAAVLSAFPALAAYRHGAHTVLTGLLDRSTLDGALAEIETLGLNLLQLRKLPPAANHQDQVSTAHPDGHHRGRTRTLLAGGDAPMTSGPGARPAGRPSPRTAERGSAELAASAFVHPPSAGRAEHGHG